jgi:Peptidase A4 family
VPGGTRQDLVEGVRKLGVVLALGALLAVSAGAAQASPPQLEPMRSIANWSGYVATGKPGHVVKYSSVTGTWTVPKAICKKGEGAASSTVWVGLGGYKTTNQEEVGTNSNCDKHGKPVYFAWFELVPYLAYQTFPNINHKVSAGDEVTGLVKILNYRLVELKVVNHTRGWTFMRKINFTSQDATTADWIVEAPATCVQYTCQEASLADFRSVTMRGISATGDGAKGNLSKRSWRIVPIKLVPTQLTVPTISPSAISSGHRGKQGQAKSPAGATPGKPSDDGSSFGVKWVAVATRGL